MKVLLGASLLVFLVVGDLWFPAGSWLNLLRLPILGVCILGALAIAVKEPGLLGRLLRPPMVFFAVFAALGLVAVFTADVPRVALRYSAGYVLVAVLAVVAAGLFTERTLLRGVLAATMVKVALSIVIMAVPFAWWSPGPRFRGLLGNPNPMGAAAGFAYLLLVVHAWHDWPRPRSRVMIVLGGLVATIVLRTTHSTSAAAATVGALLVVVPLVLRRSDTWRGRLAWFVVAGALLLPLAVTAPAGNDALGHREHPPASGMEQRVRWWGMLAPVVTARPWLGYGAGSTPALAIAGRPPWATSAHNLYFEAAIYAGLGAAAAMLLFMAGALAASIRRAFRRPGSPGAGLVAVLVFYAVLSFVEPVVLNGAPSTLVACLVAAAVCTPGGLVQSEGPS